MTSIYYLDANICIFHLRKPFGSLAEKIYSFSCDCIKIPAIVKAELMTGAMKSARSEENLEDVEAFCAPFEIVPFDDSVVKTYAKIRSTLELRGQKIGRNDTIIAATALAHNGILVTNNVKEFSRVDGLFLDDWTL